MGIQDPRTIILRRRSTVANLELVGPSVHELFIILHTIENKEIIKIVYSIVAFCSICITRPESTVYVTLAAQIGIPPLT